MDMESIFRPIGSAGTGRAAYNNYSTTQEQLNAYIGWVYGGVAALSREVAGIEFDLFTNPGRGNTKSWNSRLLNDGLSGKQMRQLREVQDSPLLDLLYRPNPIMTKTFMFQLTTIFMELTGDSFWVLTGAGDQPQEMWPLSPDRVRVIKSPTSFIGGYEYRDENGRVATFAPEEIMHFREPNPTNMYRGQGVVRAAAAAVATDFEAANYNHQFFINSANPDYIFGTDRLLSNEAIKNLKKNFNQKHVGSNQAGKTLFLEENLKPITTALSQKDMEYLEGRRFGRDEILALEGVSSSILGLQESSNRSSAEAANYSFQRHAVLFRMRTITDTLVHSLVPFFNDRYILNFENPVPRDAELVFKEKQAAVGNWRTVNEVRESEGLPSLPGGDQLYRQSQDTPMDELSGGDE